MPPALKARSLNHWTTNSKYRMDTEVPVSIIYCCLTNHPKLRGLTQQQFIFFHNFVSQEFRQGLPGTSPWNASWAFSRGMTQVSSIFQDSLHMVSNCSVALPGLAHSRQVGSQGRRCKLLLVRPVHCRSTDVTPISFCWLKQFTWYVQIQEGGR